MKGVNGPVVRIFSIYHDDPAVVPAAQLRCDIAMHVGQEVEPDDIVRVQEIPGGRHAVLSLIGPYSGIPAASRWLLESWLPQSGERLLRAPFDEYLNNPNDVLPGQLRTAICLPLVE